MRGQGTWGERELSLCGDVIMRSSLGNKASEKAWQPGVPATRPAQTRPIISVTATEPDFSSARPSSPCRRSRPSCLSNLSESLWCLLYSCAVVPFQHGNVRLIKPFGLSLAVPTQPNAATVVSTVPMSVPPCITTWTAVNASHLHTDSGRTLTMFGVHAACVYSCSRRNIRTSCHFWLYL